jgi:hypothetical protein
LSKVVCAQIRLGNVGRVRRDPAASAEDLIDISNFNDDRERPNRSDSRLGSGMEK